MVVTADREDLLFSKYRSTPDSESLADLLKAHQDRVYNICFQVLRRPEDAEDAAQHVFVEAIRWLPSIRDSKGFRVWLYRVSMHTSLKQKKSNSRRVELARRLASTLPAEGASMDSEERAALMEAIGGLDDDDRSLLLEYYFEKRTLEEIADRDGVSTVAIWKRLEQARERIKRVLVGAGFAITGSGLAHGMESITPVTAPSHFAVQALVSKAALAAAGGALVGTKVLFGVLILVVVGIFLFIGTRPGSRSSSDTGKTDGAWPGDSRKTPPAEPQGQIAGTVPASESDEARSEVRRRLLTLLTSRYGEYRDMLRRTRRGGWSFVFGLLEDKEAAKLAEWVASHPDAVGELVEIHRSSKSDVGCIALLILALGRHPQLEKFFSELIASPYPEGGFAAWGMANIGTSTALDLLTERLKGALFGEKGQGEVLQAALARAGEPGFVRILKVAEEEVHANRVTLDSLKAGVPQLRLPWLGFSDRLHELAETHHSPAIRLMAVIPLWYSRNAQEQSFALSRLGEEKDPAVREKMTDHAYTAALIGWITELQPDQTSALSKLMEGHKFFQPDSLLRGGISFDPDRYLPIIREQWSGMAEDRKSFFMANLTQAKTPEASRLAEELAMKSELTERTLSSLIFAERFTDVRLSETLFNHLTRMTDSSETYRAGKVVAALSRFPSEHQAAISVRLQDSLPVATRSARLAILTELWRFGPTTEATLLKVARSSEEMSERLAAWNAVASSPRFGPGLAREAKQFLTGHDPNLMGNPPEKWRLSLAAIYLNLVVQTYLVAGVSGDIETLTRMAENPRIPFSNHAELVELFRNETRTAIDAIRLRSPADR